MDQYQDTDPKTFNLEVHETSCHQKMKKYGPQTNLKYHKT